MNTSSVLILFAASLLVVALLVGALAPRLSGETSQATTTLDITYKRVSNAFQVVSAYTDGKYTYFLVSGYSGEVPLRALTAIIDGAPYDVNVVFVKDLDGDGLLDPSDVAYILVGSPISGEHNVSFISQTVSLPVGTVFVGERRFKYRRIVTITNATTLALYDYQVRIELNGSNFDFSHIQPDCSDLRFTDTSNNLLDFWIESCDTVDKNVVVWVKVPYIPASGETNIYLYYGAPGLVSLSNGERTFIFFDDFTSLAKWNCTSRNPDNCKNIGVSTVDGRSVVVLTSLDSNSVVLTSRDVLNNLDGVALEAMVEGYGGSPDINFYIGVDDDNQVPPNWGTRVGDNVAGQYHAVVADEAVSTIGTTYTQLFWLICHTYRQGLTIASSYNGEWLTATATTTPITTGSIFISVAPSSATLGAYIDWIRVRKYVYPEPTAVVGQEVQGSYLIG